MELHRTTKLLWRELFETRVSRDLPEKTNEQTKTKDTRTHTKTKQLQQQQQNIYIKYSLLRYPKKSLHVKHFLSKMTYFVI